MHFTFHLDATNNSAKASGTDLASLTLFFLLFGDFNFDFAFNFILPCTLNDMQKIQMSGFAIPQSSDHLV
jgi:hypothetical protein